MRDLNDAFYHWFGGSKVRHKDGSPRVVFHGTSRTEHFTKFKTPAYFAENLEYVDPFMEYSQTEDSAGWVLPCYLRIENPLDITALGTSTHDYEEFEGILSRSIPNFEGVNFEVDMRRDAPWSFIRQLLRRKLFVMLLNDAGFDGIYQVESNVWYDGKRTKSLRSKVWIALNPSQIKSAVGNDGTWDVDDPDIRSNPSLSRSDLPVRPHNPWTYRRGFGGHEAIFDVAGIPYSATLWKSDKNKLTKVVESVTGELPLEFSFSNTRTRYGDKADGFGVVGTGNARAVIKNAVSLIAWAADVYAPKSIIYSSKERSRGGLYSYLTKQSERIIPYTGFEIKDGTDKTFVLIEKKYTDELGAALDAAGYSR